MASDPEGNQIFKKTKVSMKITKTEVTADIVVEKAGTREVLLIKRKKDPFEGKWALPGGFVETDEEAATAAARELEEETSLKVKRQDLSFIDYFDAPDRDPRGRVISFAFGIKLEGSQQPKGGDDAAEAKWFSLDDLPDLAFDHQTILARWKERS